MELGKNNLFLCLPIDHPLRTAKALFLRELIVSLDDKKEKRKRENRKIVDSKEKYAKELFRSKP